MAIKKNTTIKANGKEYNYYRITRTVGHTYKDGKKVPIKKQFTGSSKRDAELKYERWKEQAAKPAEIFKTFGDLLEEYCENILPIDSRYANGTKEVYSRAYKNHLKNESITATPINDLKISDIQDYYIHLTITKGAMVHLHKFLVCFFKWASNNEYCKNMIQCVIVPEKPVVKKTDEISVWTDEELEILVKNDDYYLKNLIVFAVYSGMRISELLGLKWCDLYDDVIHVRRQYCRGEWKKPKCEKERNIPMHEKIKEIVESADKKYELVFTTSIGTPLDYKNVNRSLCRYYKRQKIKQKKFHSYRATFCTNLCKNGVPIQVASKLMGHENITVTAKYYTAIDNESMFEAVNKL